MIKTVCVINLTEYLICNKMIGPILKMLIPRYGKLDNQNLILDIETTHGKIKSIMFTTDNDYMGEDYTGNKFSNGYPDIEKLYGFSFSTSKLFNLKLNSMILKIVSVSISLLPIKYTYL